MKSQTNSYFYDQELKRYGLPGGRIFILNAEQGAGKTSAIVAFLRMDYTYFCKARLEQAIAHYNARGLDIKSLPDKTALKTHLYYSNVAIALKGTLRKPKVLTHKVSPNDIRLPDGVNPAMYFPWGSVIILQEASDTWHSHDWQSLPQNIRLWMKYLRQNNLTLIIDTHNGSDIAKQLRELATDELYVEGNYYMPPRFFGLIKARTVWYFNWSYPQRMRAAEQRGEDISAYTHKARFRIKGSVWDAYDSYSGEALFLNGIYKYGFAVKDHIRTDFAKAESIEQYCADTGIKT